MDTMGSLFGMAGFAFAIMAYLRIGALEKKLKEAGVLDKNFDSENEI